LTTLLHILAFAIASLPLQAVEPEAAGPADVAVDDGQAPSGVDAATAKAPTKESEETADEAGDSADEPPVAENVVLSEPTAPPVPPQSAVGDDAPPETTETGAPPVTVDTDIVVVEPVVLLGSTVAPGTAVRLAWSPNQSFEGIAAPTPVLVVNGVNPGPAVCLTAAVHGDELNGIEVVRRVLYDLNPEKLTGTVIGVPIVNLQGFRRSSRYLPDRRDLNRFFPGNPAGSLASRIAHSFFKEVISHCDLLVDLHTGSFHRTNLPQLRADLANPDIASLTEKFGATVVLHSAGAPGTLRRAAADAGIPAVTLEAGEPARVQEDAVSHSTKSIMTLLNQLDMVRKVTFWGSREPVYYRSTWIRADQGGVLISDVELGQRVEPGDVLGSVTDPVTNVKTDLVAPSPGRVLGMALNQLVMPGFAAYRLGIEEPDPSVIIRPLGDPDTGEDEYAEEEEGGSELDDEGPGPAFDEDDFEDADG